MKRVASKQIRRVSKEVLKCLQRAVADESRKAKYGRKKWFLCRVGRRNALENDKIAGAEDGR